MGTYVEVVKVLLQKDDVEVNLKDTTTGQTPLLQAVEKGHLAVVKLLLEKDNVDINSKDPSRSNTLINSSGHPTTPHSASQQSL